MQVGSGDSSGDWIPVTCEEIQMDFLDSAFSLTDVGIQGDNQQMGVVSVSLK